jgi:hypothetical protein
MRTTGNEEPQTNAKNAYVCATRYEGENAYDAEIEMLLAASAF